MSSKSSPNSLTLQKPHPNALKHDVHMLPKPPDRKRHISSMECWCSPFRDPNAPLFVVHNRHPHAAADQTQSPAR
jgi:hypothetical protein